MERWALARCHDVTEALVRLNAEKTLGRGPDAGDLQRLDKTDLAEEGSCTGKSTS
ncbi:hypothetical protein PI124_g20775 [Phytophthora idaei]|nr:hypothetical protein PI124_g20775 [Phytophthora idaei]